MGSNLRWLQRINDKFPRKMPKMRKTRRFAEVKRMISPKDERLQMLDKRKKKKAVKNAEGEEVKEVVPLPPSHLFLKYNTQLGPPYRIFLDTNFINFSIQNKLDIRKAMMDCLYAEVIPCVTECVIAELEKVPKFKVALRVAKDTSFQRFKCDHKGTYADDCLVNRAEMHRCFIIATCDKNLKRRIRKIPGVPIMYIKGHKYSIERLPEALGAPQL